MSLYQGVTVVNLVAGEDLRNGKNLLLKIENDGGVGKVIKTTGAGDLAVGILAENPTSGFDTDGMGVPVALLEGVVGLVAGNVVTAGDYVTPSGATAGQVLGSSTIAAGVVIVGVALESAVTGDVFNVICRVIRG